MLTNRISAKKIETGFGHLFLGLVLGVAMMVWLVDFILTEIPESLTQTNNQTVNQTEALGVSLIADHVLAFELIAVLLLIALIGAAFIAKGNGKEAKE